MKLLPDHHHAEDIFQNSSRLLIECADVGKAVKIDQVTRRRPRLSSGENSPWLAIP